MGLFKKFSKTKVEVDEKEKKSEQQSKNDFINKEINDCIAAFKIKDEYANNTAFEQILKLSSEHGSIIAMLLIRAYGYSDIDKANVSVCVFDAIKQIGIPSPEEIENIFFTGGPQKNIGRSIVYKKKIIYLLANIKTKDSFDSFCKIFETAKEPNVINFMGYAFKNFGESSKDYLQKIIQIDSFDSLHKKAANIPLEALKDIRMKAIVEKKEVEDEQDNTMEILRKTVELPKKTVDEYLNSM